MELAEHGAENGEATEKLRRDNCIPKDLHV